MTINDFKPGDVLVITSSSTGRGRVEHEAEVTAVNWKGNGLVTYSGLTCGQGAFRPEDLFGLTREFGFVVAVRKIGHRKPWAETFHGPRPGDRAYDLMC